MQLSELIQYYTDNKKNDKSSFGDTIPKALKKYNDHGVSLEVYYKDIDNIWKSYSSLSPFTQRNYINCIKLTLDTDIIKNNVSENTREKALKTLTTIIREANHKANTFHKTIGGKEDVNKVPLNNEILDIEVSDTEETILDNPIIDNSIVDKDSKIIQLETENNRLHNEIKWLRECIMHLCTQLRTPSLSRLD